MRTDDLILRETDFPPLINKDDFISNADFDSNFIRIYEDFLDLCNSENVENYSSATTYNDDNYVMNSGKLWQSIKGSDFSNVTPGTDVTYWVDRFPTVLAHIKNSDLKLAEGTANEVTASEIRAFIDAGLTSTTNLSITERTSVSFKINSSTGTDVIVTEASSLIAGLLSAEDKIKLGQTSNTNTGDQTLTSLGAEAVANKAIDFDVLNDELYPTTRAVNAYLTVAVGDLVDDFVGGNYATKRLEIATNITVSATLSQAIESSVIGVGLVGGPSTAIELTIPLNATVPIAIGSQYMIYLVDATAPVGFLAESGVTIVSAGDLVDLDTVGAVCTLVKIAINTWLLTGKLA